jgi:hypothetical protein
MPHVRARRSLAVVALLLVAAVAGWLTTLDERSSSRESRAVPGMTVAAAFAERRSDVWVEDDGRVETILRDDREGSRHQRFILRLTSGGTLLVSHNIDLAPRVPVAVGDQVSIRGEYVWNDKGGLVHWTHHDPSGRLPGGWVRHEGREYR